MLNKYNKCGGGGGGDFKEDIHFTNLITPRGLGECETQMRCGWQGMMKETGSSHNNSTCSGFLGFVQRHVQLLEFMGHASKRFLNYFHIKVAINAGAHCQGRGSDSLVLVCKSPIWLGMKETSVHPLSVMISYLCLSKFMS